MHGQGVSWQLPSPQHKVPAGWLGDVTMMLSQSWEIFPDLVNLQFPSKPSLWDAQELECLVSIRADGNVQPPQLDSKDTSSTH